VRPYTFTFRGGEWRYRTSNPNQRVRSGFQPGLTPIVSSLSMVAPFDMQAGAGAWLPYRAGTMRKRGCFFTVPGLPYC